MSLLENIPANTQGSPRWSVAQKFFFCFFFIYLILQMNDWWLSIFPYEYYVTQWYYGAVDWSVHFANDHFFHIRKILVDPAGSGDTSWGWAEQWFFVCVALIGSVVWSLIDRRRKAYRQLNYWLCLLVRYYIALVAFTYGIEKLFALQMPPPALSQLETPLGDFLPMRLCWMFIGYSTPYQVFSGVMETAIGILLLNRRTATLGAILATAVFTNVMVLNLSYDIPVKLFSMNLVVACLFLLVNEYNRLVCFFILNKPANECSVYHYSYSGRWKRITRIILKTVFILLAVINTFYNNWQEWQSRLNLPVSKPIRSGIYDVTTFAVNGDTLSPLVTDGSRWQDVIFEKNGTGSLKTNDTIFAQRYGRSYFLYSTNTVSHQISFQKKQWDSTMFSGVVLSMHYQFPDSNTIQLQGKEKDDSLYVLLRRNDRHFQLTDKPFHWLSEYNR